MCSEPLFSCDLCHADSNYGGRTWLQKKIYPVLASYWQLSSMKRCQSRQLCLTVWLRGMSNRIWMGKFFQATAISLGHSLHRLPGFLYCRMSPVALMLQWIICCASEAHSWGVRHSFPLWLKNGTAGHPCCSQFTADSYPGNCPQPKEALLPNSAPSLESRPHSITGQCRTIILGLIASIRNISVGPSSLRASCEITWIRCCNYI